MTYTLYYVSQDSPAGTWSVYVEEYETFDAPEPIEGTTRLVSGNHPDEESADTEARARQRRSYAEARVREEQIHG